MTRSLLESSLKERFIGHRDALQDAYAAMPTSYFDEVESAIRFCLDASGRGLLTCLDDLDRFNTLSKDTENDAWYDLPDAVTSMHLDALILGFSRRRLEATRDQILDLSSDAQLLLEVGCGSGRLSEQLLDSLPRSHMTLIDRSAAAVRFVERLHAARGTSARVRCMRGDLQAIDAPDGAFDLVIATEVLEHAADVDRCVLELLRVLRPRGALAVSIPIALDIAMHPVVFASADDVLSFMQRFGLTILASDIVAPLRDVDAIAQVFPDFSGCVNATFCKP